MILRPYQQSLIDEIRKELHSGKKSICAVLGCGGGKSVVQGCIAKSATDKGNRVLFLVHRIELCRQIEETFRLCGVNFNLCDVSMVQTVARRLDTIQEPKLIITDEAHHSLSNTYLRIYEKFPKATRLGFTATPCRMNDGGLGKVYESLIEGVSTKWLIENNYLAPYRYFSVKLADVSNLHIKHGDYDSQEIAALMEQHCIYGDTVKTYRQIADGKKAIVYCASVNASKETAAAFLKDGIVAAHLDGTTATEQRNNTIQAFRRGEIKVLCNVDLFGEGFDVPDCECVILLRPTRSLTVFIQQSMRSMRYKKDKTAIIIDHVGNIYLHGFPDNDREWTLKGKTRKQGSNVHIKQCPKCFACMPSLSRICPECGYAFTPEEMRQYTQVDAKLEELKRLEILAAMPYSDYKKIKTFDDMVRFQKAKKFKFAWALHKCEELGIDIPSKYDYMRRFMQ